MSQDCLDDIDRAVMYVSSQKYLIDDLNFLRVIIGTERYYFVYDDESRDETHRSFGRFAENPELSFCWYHAAILSLKLRQESHEQKVSKKSNSTLTHDLDDLIYGS